MVCFLLTNVFLSQLLTLTVRTLLLVGNVAPHKQKQNFCLSLKLLIETRKAHVIPIVAFKDTFLFPGTTGLTLDRGGALENTYALAQFPFFLVSEMLVLF